MDKNHKFVIVAFLMLVVDLIWINIVMLRPYEHMIKDIQGSNIQINKFYVVASYICALILLYIIINNNLSLIEAFLIGFSSWGVYDFTAGVFLKKWSLSLSIVDVLWGGTLLMTMKYISDKL
jgi:uncharacterized membrane protein